MPEKPKPDVDDITVEEARRFKAWVAVVRDVIKWGPREWVAFLGAIAIGAVIASAFYQWRDTMILLAQLMAP